MLQPVHGGLLLTGGRSSRMGRDKASIVIGGASLAEHAASSLRAVASRVVCVGPSSGTDLPSVADPGEGPLVAFDYGCEWLQRNGFQGAVIALACDMPFVTAEVLLALTRLRHGADAIVPTANGMLQPLAAIYSPRSIATAAQLVQSGFRSMKDLLARIRVEIVPSSALGTTDEIFEDLDTPQDLERVAAALGRFDPRLV